MNHIETMKLALDALENHSGNYKLSKNEGIHYNKAITALRQAIEQPDMGIDRGAWSDVPDASKWLDELRGDETEHQPEAWPHKWGCRANAFGKCDKGCTAPPKQPEQKPVAWVRNLIDPQPHCVTDLAYRSVADTEAGVQYIPLYTAPPKQEFVCSTGLCHYKHWVGLTNEEIVKASIGHVEGEHMLPHSFARAIEKLLREKNHD